MAEHRYPFQPVDVLAVRSAGSRKAAAALLGVAPRQYHRWLAAGQVTRDAADRIADGLRMHPWELWPEMRDHDIDQDEATRRERAAARKRKQYRHRKTEILERNRRYRQDAARAISIQRKARYQANVDQERARARAYYEANRERMKAAARARRAAQRVEQQDEAA